MIYIDNNILKKDRLCSRKCENSIVDVLHLKSQNVGKQSALIFSENGQTATASLTYHEIDYEARKIAVYLTQKLGIQPGERILLLHPPGLEFVKALFGCLYAGAIAIPAYVPRPNRSIVRIENIITDSKATVGITTAKAFAQFSKTLQSNLVLKNLSWFTNEEIEDQNYSVENWQKPEINHDTIAFLQYTSGSTGQPKGVMVSHGNILYNSEYIKQSFELNESSVSVSWLPHFHDMGLIDGIIQPLYTGFLGVLIPPVTFLGRPLRWLEAISQYGATHCGAPNFAYELCLKKIKPEQKKHLNLSTWQTAYNGSEPVRKETLTAFATYFKDCGFKPQFFYPCYGLAEATLMVTGGKVNQKPQVLTLDVDALTENRVVISNPNTKNTKDIVSCGYPRLETEILIVNPQTLVKCQPAQVGEVWVSGATVAKGYWNKAQASLETFPVADNQLKSFVRTGDLGFIYQNELYITGRIKDLIILKGENHYPQDIELTVANSHPGLRHDCGAAFAIDLNGNERLVIIQEVAREYLKKIDVEAATADICYALMKNHNLQAYDLVLIKTNTIPKTSSGKIQRQRCRQQYLEGTLATLVSQVVNPALGKNRHTANNKP